MKTLGILGGMGPLATATLFKKIVMLTKADSDQEHMNIMIYNNTKIPDRTQFIIGNGEDPRSYLIESAQKLEKSGADFLIMPCNTAHYFYEEIVKNINIPFLSMIDETAKYIQRAYGSKIKVGLMATEGTCRAGVYDSIFRNYDMNIVKPDEEAQNYITELIYGIKNGKIEIDMEKWNNTIKNLRSKEAIAFILGCTELSAAYEIFNMPGKYVDPIEVIAKSSIIFAGKQVKEGGGA